MHFALHIYFFLIRIARLSSLSCLRHSRLSAASCALVLLLPRSMLTNVPYWLGSRTRAACLGSGC